MIRGTMGPPSLHCARSGDKGPGPFRLCPAPVDPARASIWPPIRRIVDESGVNLAPPAPLLKMAPS